MSWVFIGGVGIDFAADIPLPCVDVPCVCPRWVRTSVKKHRAKSRNIVHCRAVHY